VIADITDERDRTKGMGIIGAAFGLGFICGPALAAVLVSVAHWLPGVAAAATSATALVLVAVALPETRRAPVDGEVRPRRGRLDGLRRLAGEPVIGACLAMVFLIIFAFSNFETTFAQLLRLRFAMNMSSVGWMFVYAGVLGAVVQGGLVGRLAPRVGERRLIAAGGAIAAVAAGALPFAGSTGRLLAVLAVLAVGHGLLAPSLSSLTSRLVPSHEVGEVMGASQGVSSLARIFGPFWAEWVYGASGPAAPYLSAAAAYAVSVVVILAARRTGAAGRGV
jgi:DHA1 family tetracycline resistance protein-like MFS transporter